MSVNGVNPPTPSEVTWEWFFRDFETVYAMVLVLDSSQLDPLLRALTLHRIVEDFDSLQLAASVLAHRQEAIVRRLSAPGGEEGHGSADD